MFITRKGKTITLLTSISGEINGVEFIAYGQGKANLERGISTSRIVYRNFPQDFSPILCRSWKCKHHLHIALEVEGGRNLFTISQKTGVCDYDIFETIYYPDGEIFTYGKVRILPTYQIVISRFDGWYRGPIDVKEQEPYEEILIPAGRGRIYIKGKRKVIFADRSDIKIRWDGEIVFLDKSVELPYEEILFYKPKEDFDRKSLTYSTQMEVNIKPKV